MFDFAFLDDTSYGGHNDDSYGDSSMDSLSVAGDVSFGTFFQEAGPPTYSTKDGVFDTLVTNALCQPPNFNTNQIPNDIEMDLSVSSPGASSTLEELQGVKRERRIEHRNTLKFAVDELGPIYKTNPDFVLSILSSHFVEYKELKQELVSELERCVH